MMTDEGEGYHADGLEDAVVDEEAALKLPAELRRLDRSLRDDGEKDNDHRDESKCGCFRKLDNVSVFRSVSRES